MSHLTIILIKKKKKGKIMLGVIILLSYLCRSYYKHINNKKEIV